MKKLLSLILVAVMIVTTIPIVFAEDETYKVGDIIQFGSYPQSDVKDKTLIAELNALAPAWDNWTSYDYYNGSGSYGTMKQGDWMRYVDIEHDGNLYRGVKISSYRPYNVLYRKRAFGHNKSVSVRLPRRQALSDPAFDPSLSPRAALRQRTQKIQLPRGSRNSV